MLQGLLHETVIHRSGVCLIAVLHPYNTHSADTLTRPDVPIICVPKMMLSSVQDELANEGISFSTALSSVTQPVGFVDTFTQERHEHGSMKTEALRSYHKEAVAVHVLIVQTLSDCCHHKHRHPHHITTTILNACASQFHIDQPLCLQPLICLYQSSKVLVLQAVADGRQQSHCV